MIEEVIKLKMVKEKITAIIPTYNEEIHIEDAINSVSFADEIVVIDSFSTDRTVDLAKKYAVKVIQRVFDDFSSQKNYAIERAKHNWIYILDADERVSEELRLEISDTMKKTDQKVGFIIYRTFYYFDKKINFGGWQRDKVLRLFRKDKCRYNGDLVHERVKYDGEIGVLKHKIDHFSYQGFDHYTHKLEHYATLKAKALYKKNKSVNIFHLYIKPPVRFFIDYIIKFGILDGEPGFILAKHQFHGVKARYTNLRRLYKNDKHSRKSNK